MYTVKPDASLAKMVRKVFDVKVEDKICTFPFSLDLNVMLEGDFLDRLVPAIRKIRETLKDADPLIQKNGEALIDFMKKITK